MGWTVNFFAYKAALWNRWADKARIELKFGHESYARRQEAFWLSLEDNALQSFQRAILTVNKGHNIGHMPGLDRILETLDEETKRSGDAADDSDIIIDFGSPISSTEEDLPAGSGQATEARNSDEDEDAESVGQENDSVDADEVDDDDSHLGSPMGSD